MSKFAPDVPSSLIDAVSSVLGEAKIEPSKPDPAAVARKKKLDALRDKQAERDSEKEKEHSNVRKIAGKAYGGAKQKDEPELDEGVTPPPKVVPSGKPAPSLDRLKTLNKGTNKALGIGEELKGGQKKLDKNHNGKLDSDDFKKLRASKKDETCGCSEETVEENTLSAKAGRAGKDLGKPGKNFAMIAAKAGKRYGSAESGKRVAGAILAKMRAKHEEVELDERTLTSGETKEKEHIVKSMKKNLAGFKSRYGDRAKNVMYATATKMAKEEVESNEEIQIDEGRMKDIYTTMQSHAEKKGYSSPKDFNKSDYEHVGKEHGISGGDVAIIAGHHTAHSYSKLNEYKGQPAGIPFDADKPHAKIAVPGKKGYGPSAAKHLAKQGMKQQQQQTKEETVVEGTGGPIYSKPIVRLSDIVARLKDARNLKKAKLVNNIGESPDEEVKESFEDEHGIGASKKKVKKETLMGKAGCTSEDVELDERVITPGTGTSPDPLLARTGLNKVLRKPRAGQTNLKNIPAGNLPGSRLKFSDDDKTRQRTLLKTAIKSTLANKEHGKSKLPEEVSIDETASLDKYIRSMGYDPQHLDKNKKVMFAKTNAYKTWQSSQTEGLYDGGQKGTQDIDTHMSPGATARG
jgi:hypothetical protein